MANSPSPPLMKDLKDRISKRALELTASNDQRVASTSSTSTLDREMPYSTRNVSSTSQPDSSTSQLVVATRTRSSTQATQNPQVLAPPRSVTNMHRSQSPRPPGNPGLMASRYAPQIVDDILAPDSARAEPSDRASEASATAESSDHASEMGNDEAEATDKAETVVEVRENDRGDRTTTVTNSGVMSVVALDNARVDVGGIHLGMEGEEAVGIVDAVKDVVKEAIMEAVKKEGKETVKETIREVVKETDENEIVTAGPRRVGDMVREIRPGELAVHLLLLLIAFYVGTRMNAQM